MSAPTVETVTYWKKIGVNAFHDNGTVAEESDIIFLAIKPAILPAAVADIYKTIKNPLKVKNKLFVSILAGIKIDSLENVILHFCFDGLFM